MPLSLDEKKRAKDFFTGLQKNYSLILEKIDGKAKIQEKSWSRAGGGGGSMHTLRGELVEKAGVNVSEVFGDNFPLIESSYAGKPFYATGLSTICHMMNPFAPIAHMNVRLLEAGDDFWFGGGADLTPMQEFPEDTQAFHKSLEKACARISSSAYSQYKKNCDEYFYIPHRKSSRGVGGIFFDHLKGDFSDIFPFVQEVALAFVETYPKILERRKNINFTAEDKEKQLYWRARYAEFNLAYDKGTKFGFMTGGNTEAILVSMPPVVKW